MTEPGLSVASAGHVALVLLDRPSRKNAVNADVLNGLIAEIDRIDADDDIRVVVLAANGDHFCVGADLSQGAEVFDAAKQRRPEQAPDLGGMLALRILACRKPVIAAIHGIAAGFGASITLACDLRIAAEGSRIAFPFLARGLCTDACASWLLPRLVGTQRAAYWLYTARVISAAEALEAGLLLEVTQTEALRERALSVAREISSRTSPVALAFTKQLMMRGLGETTIEHNHHLESRFLRYMSTRADVAEGVRSYLEKRPPQFQLKVSRDMPPFYPWWRDDDVGNSNI